MIQYDRLRVIGTLSARVVIERRNNAVCQRTIVSVGSPTSEIHVRLTFFRHGRRDDETAERGGAADGRG